MNAFLSWDFLATFAGASVAGTVLTQIIKKYVTFDPKYIALAVTIIVVVGVQLFHLHDYSAGGIVMAILNGFLAAGSSVGIYETVIKPMEPKPQEDNFDSEVQGGEQ